MRASPCRARSSTTGGFRKRKHSLEHPALLEDWENHQWHQHLRAYLMFATQRWPDVITEVTAPWHPERSSPAR